MELHEKNEKKRLGISLIDFLIVLIVIACIAGTFVHYKLYEKNNEINTDDVCLVSILFEDVGNDMAELYAVGDKLYRDGEELFGTVVEVSSVDADFYYTNARNEIVKGVDSNKKNVSVIVRVNGDVTSDGFYANGVDYVASGMDIDVYSSKISGKGLIFDVKKQAE